MTLVTQPMTMLVNDAEDNLLSTADDVAVIPVEHLIRVTLSVNHVADDPDQTNGTKSSLDLETPGTNIDTVIEAVSAGVAGDNLAITFADGSAVDEGELSRVGNEFTFAFKNGVTTVLDFEDAVDALTGADALIQVKTVGTPANVLATTDDEFVSENLAGGADGEGTFTLTITKSIDGVNFVPVDTLDEGDFGDGSNLSVEIPLRDANGMWTSQRVVKIELTTLDDSSKFSVSALGEHR